MKIKVLSLFDGISCARVALERAGFDIEKYYASEIDKYTIQIAQKNYPDTIQVGSVTELKGEDFKDIDLLIGGSPCQDLSIAKKDRQGLKGARSGLFFEYVRILKEVKPKYFILENVNSMPKEAKEQISEIMGVEPIMINAALVSAQNRKRLFWTNIPNVTQPEDRGILLRDILEDSVDEHFYVKDKSNTIRSSGRGSGIDDKHNLDSIRIGDIGSNAQAHRVYSPDGKSVTLSALGGGQGAKTGLYAVASRTYPRTKKNGELRVKQIEIRKDNKANSITTVQGDSMVGIVQKSRGFNKGGIKAQDGKVPTLSSSSWQENNKLTDGIIIRKLTPIECERLQSLPDNYTEGVSSTQRYKALGNAFNVEVVKHIVSFIK